MSKHVLIISSSPRPGSNSDALAAAFAEGAESAGHTVEIIRLTDKTIHFCRGCLACQQIGRCVIEDDANAITEKMRTADVIAFATPIYYYEMSGQLKTMLDRANALYSLDYAFRDVWLIASAAEGDDHAWQNAANGIRGWCECFEKSRFAGVVFAGGKAEPGWVQGDADALARARAQGASIA